MILEDTLNKLTALPIRGGISLTKQGPRQTPETQH